MCSQISILNDDTFLNKHMQSVKNKSWNNRGCVVLCVCMCVQEGAIDLLRELKGFNMTLKLLQVGASVLL